MRIDEPSPKDVNRAVRSLKLVFKLLEHDPLADSARGMLEAAFGVDMERDLVRWLREPIRRRKLRDAFVLRISEIWK